ncbi:tetratricopeptide repeat protein, partial [candidate division WOR-3 bacterium]|nr:tetratricopeptide repeat protein [candidate division WOR-3 bacterium]
NKGFVHCDLKPEHILFDPHQEQVKLIDFGFAGVPDQEFEAAGTLGYMAPEILKGIANNQRSDLYSLGVIMREIISGDRMNRISTPLPEVPDEIGKVLTRLISAEPALRPTIPELYQTLTKYAQSADIELSAYEVRLPSTGYVEVDGIIDQICRKKGPCAIVLGDTGLGKTRLLQELKFQCLMNGNEVVHYQATEGMSLLEILCKRLKTSSKEISKAEDKYQIFEEITQSLIKAAKKNKLIILIDDLDTVTEYELALFRYIGYGITASNVLLIGTAKPSDKITALGFEHIMLKPLSKNEIASLIESTFADISMIEANGPETFAEWLHKQTGGNPLFSVEVLKTLYDKEILGYRNNQWQVATRQLDEVSLPRNIAELVSTRLDVLVQDECHILKVLAFADQPVEPAIIRDITDGNFDISVEHLKSLGLVREDTINGQRMLSVMNKLTTDHVVGKIADEETRSLCSALVTATMANASDDAFYFNMLGRLNDQIGDAAKAYDYYQRAAVAAEAIYDYDSALRNYERAAGRVKELEPQKYPEILLKIGEINAKLGRNETATETYRTILDTADSTIAAKVHCGLGKVSAAKGEYEKAVNHYSTALANTPEDSIEHVQISLLLGYAQMNLAQYDDAERILNCALDATRQSCNVVYQARAMYALASMDWYKNDFKKGPGKAERLLEYCSQHRLKSELPLARNLAGLFYRQTMNTNKAQLQFQASVEEFRAIKRVDALCAALNNSAQLLSQHGDYLQAEQLLEQATTIAQQIGNKSVYTAAMTNFAIINGVLGRIDESISRYDRILAVDPESIWAIYGKTMALLSRNRYTDAQSTSERACAGVQNALLEIGRAAIAVRDDPNKCRSILVKSLPFIDAEKPDISLRIQYFEKASSLYFELGDFENSSHTVTRLLDLVIKDGREYCLGKALWKMLNYVL